jgi:hypothetical protein
VKYLKTFESLSVDTLREGLTEICYELTDGGFRIKISDSNDLPNLNLPSDDKVLFIGLENRDYQGFSFNDVKEVVLRVVDYLGDRYKECSVLPVIGNRRLVISQHLRLMLQNISPDISEIGNLTNLIIIYR